MGSSERFKAARKVYLNHPPLPLLPYPTTGPLGFLSKIVIHFIPRSRQRSLLAVDVTYHAFKMRSSLMCSMQIQPLARRPSVVVAPYNPGGVGGHRKVALQDFLLTVNAVDGADFSATWGS